MRAAFVRWFPLVVLGGALFFGGLSCVGGWLPTMVDAEGRFTLPARRLNLLGGAGFIAAAVFFILRYHRGGAAEDWLFAVHTSLFGAAGVLFELSSMWDAAWWWWHILRLVAYIAALAFAARAFLAAETEVFGLNRQLADLNRSLDRRSQSDRSLAGQRRAV
jgi:hypothetical protein